VILLTSWRISNDKRTNIRLLCQHEKIGRTDYFSQHSKAPLKCRTLTGFDHRTGLGKRFVTRMFRVPDTFWGFD
jgi:hypothetical protein